ncbi:hypothetical protein ACFQ5B_21055 [Laceyella putida]
MEDLKDARLRGLAYYEAGARFALDDKVMQKVIETLKIDSVRLKETLRHQNGFVDVVKEHILSAIKVKELDNQGQLLHSL